MDSYPSNINIHISGPFVVVTIQEDESLKVGVSPLRGTQPHMVKAAIIAAFLEAKISQKIDESVTYLYGLNPTYVIENLEDILGMSLEDKRNLYKELLEHGD